MELTKDVINRVVLPTAAFVESYESPVKWDQDLGEEEGSETISWQNSELNPKNRIDSLDEVVNPKWRIDGSAGTGTQFFTIPLFFTGRLIPMRIDTFIPESSRCSARLQKILGIHTAFHMRDERVARLGISRHILRTLEYWTSINPGLETSLNNLPFGSRIVFENLAADVRDIRVVITQNHNLELQLLPCAALRALWEIPTDDWPEVIDISQVQLRRQLHDSVSLVEILSPRGPQIMILKALTSHPKYLYHELKILLTLAPHPNIISRPQHIVTKRGHFGGNVGVIGFTVVYHPVGTLRDVLAFRHLQGTLVVADQLKWAIQLTSALIHIREHGRFYSDLRLDNILLSETDDVVLVDFEQRGVWCSFGSPELNCLDYVFTLATDSDVPQAARENYGRLLKRNIPGYKALLGDNYSNSEHGYCVPWSELSRSEREAAEVFMLGRVLWCIFEGQSCPEVAVWQSYPYESDLEFPAYRNTPQEIRKLICECTRGGEKATSWRQGGVIRRGNRLVLRGGDGEEGPGAVQAEATRWWKRELQEAVMFLETKDSGIGLVHRPSLDKVLVMLESFQDTLKPREG